MAGQTTTRELDDQVRAFEGPCHAIVSRYYAPGFDRDDLMQEARIAVLSALESFRGDRGNLDAFVRFVVARRVQTAILAANRKKHEPLNHSSRAARDADGDWVDVAQLIAAGEGADPAVVAIDRERLKELGRELRERLTDVECACLVGSVNGESYEQIASREDLTAPAVDRALTTARWKLRGMGPPSKPEVGTRDRGELRGYVCPGCGGPTTKKPGPGRPPRCVMCRVSASRRRAA